MASAVYETLTRNPGAALAVGITVGLALPVAVAQASNLPVSNCDDSGTGSLRATVAAAVSGDTIDLSALACSRISLTTGQINVVQGSLTLQGSSAGQIEITGKAESAPILYHFGSGSLSLDHLLISYGRSGCITSAGSVVLTHSRVTSCVGGGVLAEGSLLVKYSAIDTNIGTGASTRGAFVSNYSTISGNIAIASDAGGVSAERGANVANSTISNNTAVSFGGLMISGLAANGDVVQISNSTISGNVANGSPTGGLTGGIFVYALPTTISYSTIAFNTATIGHYSLVPGGPSIYAAPGLTVAASFSHPQSVVVTLKSSLLSNNTYSGNVETDFSAAGQAVLVSVTSSNSLVRAARGPAQPATVSIQCPLLGPLRDNGGLTLTHALLSGSPALDHGASATTPQWDQRGAPFKRISGAHADIGAYEVQQADAVFSTSFEGCPLLQ